MSIKKKLYLLLNRIRFNFPIKIVNINKGIDISIHEKYRKKIKFIKYLIAILGIIPSFFLLTITKSIIISIMLFVITFIIEKIGFHFITIYVTPILDTKITLNHWIGTGFGYAIEKGNQYQIPVIQLIFSNIKTAQLTHKLLLIWNSNHLRDDNYNIKMSIIVNPKKKHYFVIIMPNIERKEIIECGKIIEKSRKNKKETFDDKHKTLYIMQPLKKEFIISNNTYLYKFKERYSDDIPFLLQFCYASNVNEKSVCIDDLNDFILFSLKILDKSELSRKYLEYDLIKI